MRRISNWADGGLRNKIRNMRLATVGVFVLCLMIALLRIRHSIDRIPPDPGFWFLEQVRDNGILHILSNQDGFLHIAPRLLFEIVALVPIEYQAISSSIIMQFVFAIVAFFVFLIVQIEHQNSLRSLISALIVITVPAASESTVGNLGSVKWPLTILLIFVLSSSKTMTRHKIFSCTCAVLVGLSQPFSILFIFHNIFKKLFHSRAKFTYAEWCVVCTAIVQVGAWITSGVALQKYGDPTYFGWPGMGIFWYSVWLVPTLASIFTLLIIWLFFGKRLVDFEFEIKLALAAAFLAIVTYAQLGIKDSSAVAPQAVSLVALFSTVFRIGEILGVKRKWQIVAPILLLISIASFKWFNASWYLTSGPTWSSEIRQKRELCLRDALPSVIVPQFMGDITLECNQILKGT